MFNTNSGYSLSDLAAVTGNSNNGFGGDGAWWIILLFLFAFNGQDGFGFGGNGRKTVTTETRSAVSDGFALNNLERDLQGIQQGICDGFYAMNTGVLNGFAGVNNAISSLGYNISQGFNTNNIALMQGQHALSNQLANCCCDTQSSIKQLAYDNATGLNAVSRQIADCCCETGRQIERGFADLNYNMATNTCAIQTSLANSTRDIIDNQTANARAILDYLANEKIADLQNENQALRLAASQQAQNSYLISELSPKIPVPAYQVPNPFTPYGYACCQ